MQGARLASRAESDHSRESEALGRHHRFGRGSGADDGLGPLSRAFADAYMTDVPVNWFQLTGMVAVIGGGLLVQTTWTR